VIWRSFPVAGEKTSFCGLIPTFFDFKEINRNGHDSSSSGQCMSAVINNLCSYSCPWFALGVLCMFTAHIYIYIYTLGVGDSFKKPWLHDRCFFLEISTFSQMHSDYIFLRGHCGQYPWRSWLYIGVMDRYWDYKSMTCDDNIDWFSQDDQEIIRLMSRFKITLSCQRLVTPMQK